MKRFLLCSLLLIFTLGLAGGPVDLDSLWKGFVAREGDQWMPHFNGNRGISSLYGRSSRKFSSAKEAVTDFLQRYDALLGIESASDLRLTEVQKSALGDHFYYRQYFSGHPVAGGTVAIHVNRSNQIIAASSQYKPGLKGKAAALRPVQEAVSTIRRFFGNDAGITNSGLWIVPASGEATPAWRMEVDSEKWGGRSWLLYVDATNPNAILRFKKTHVNADGQGNIWSENPVVTPTRSFQTLPHMDGSKSLSGNYSKIYDANFTKDVPSTIDLSDYTTAKESDRNYDYPEGDARLTETMAYYHINKVHDQWGSFGFTGLNAKMPIFVNVADEDNGDGMDNAYFGRNKKYKRTGIMVLGSGNELENLGLDGDVYYHEYGHAVLDKVRKGFFEAIESNYPAAIHEGFGDISSASVTGNSKLAEFGLRDKSSKKWEGRDIDNTNSYPNDVIDPQFKQSESHYTGLIFGGAWWDLQKAIGAGKAQEILYNSLSLLPAEDATFFDVRDAMVTANKNAVARVSEDAVTTAFSKHGVKGNDPGQKGSVDFSGLKFGVLNINSGSVTFKSSFSRGSYVYVVAGYKGTNLTPGYNMIPQKLYIKGVGGGSYSISISYWNFIDEAVNGAHTGKDGVWQLLVYFYSYSTPRKYELTLESRLGGTDETTTKSSNFTLN